MHLTIRTDGGARGNPGPAGIGVVIEDEKGKVLEEHAKFLGVKTNNQAEYEAAILGLERAKKLEADSVKVFADSELLVKQAMGVYKVKHENIKPLHARLKALMLQIGHVKFEHVRREKNTHADALSNQAMDEGMQHVARSS
ncbi:ribonuclease HI family protein [Patescibacteria group bacterium]|jgi:ribonuclease HI|nr:ribonuclease HI family protein [Patescibacteria group bacterium]